jgi:hypothetical protein
MLLVACHWLYVISSTTVFDCRAASQRRGFVMCMLVHSPFQNLDRWAFLWVRFSQALRSLLFAAGKLASMGLVRSMHEWPIEATEISKGEEEGSKNCRCTSLRALMGRGVEGALAAFTVCIKPR